MKLAAIYNVFDGEELLAGSVRSVQNSIDLFIFVVSTVGQSGEFYSGGLEAVEQLQLKKKIVVISNEKELRKRNIGLQKAREQGCTHFILMDCDEYWNVLDRSQIDTAHRLFTYFKHPTLQLTPPEDYYVPGICTLKSSTKVGAFNCGFWSDPTRRPNHKLTEGKDWMHHFSYVRKDIERKIRNSSARRNIQAKQDILLDDLDNACDGYMVKFFEKSCKLVPNYFDIPCL
jgi:hypothetical protein